MNGKSVCRDRKNEPNSSSHTFSLKEKKVVSSFWGVRLIFYKVNLKSFQIQIYKEKIVGLFNKKCGLVMTINAHCFCLL